jgi:predicted nucleotidyltransferase
MYISSDIETIKQIILANVPDVEDIVLFGSYARGTATQDSDMDFIVLINCDLDRKEKLDLLAIVRRAIARLRYNADILIKNKNTYLKEIKLPTLARTINSKWVFIWTKN